MPAVTDLPDNIRALAAHQMAELRDSSWSDDVARLCRDIKLRRARGSWRESLRRHRLSAAITLLLAVAAGGYSAYVYARGSRTAVPDVAGLTLDQATRVIADAGLRVGVVSKAPTNEQPPGTVARTGPRDAGRGAQGHGRVPDRGGSESR